MSDRDLYASWVVTPGTGDLTIVRAWRTRPVEGGLAVSPDGAVLATVGADKTCALWSTMTGELLRRLAVGIEVLSVAFHPDGERIFLGGDGGASLLSVETSTGNVLGTWSLSEEVAALAGTPDCVRSIQFGPTGRLALLEPGAVDFAAESWTPQFALVVWDVDAGSPVSRLLETEVGRWTDARLSDDEETFQVTLSTGVARFETRTGKPVRKGSDRPARRVTRLNSRCEVRAEDGAVLASISTGSKDVTFTRHALAPGGSDLFLATNGGLVVRCALTTR